jgi:hypothetical protein
MDTRHPPPPLEVIACGQEWLSAKLMSELDVLLNLIHLAEREPDQYKKYLSLAEETVGRIRLMSQESRPSKQLGTASQ